MSVTRKTTHILILVTILALSASCPAVAQIINGTITGTVTGNSLGAPGIKVGDNVTGTYSYDSSMVLTDGFGRQANALTSFSLDIGGNPHVFTLSDLQPALLDRERILNFSSPTVDSLEFFFQSNLLSSALGTPIGGQGVTNGLPQTFSVFGNNGTELSFNFKASPNSAVPEPGTFAFVISTVVPGGVFLVRRRRLRIGK